MDQTREVGVGEVDFEMIEHVSESHLGKDYTVLRMRNGEVLTVKNSIEDVRQFIKKVGQA